VHFTRKIGDFSFSWGKCDVLKCDWYWIAQGLLFVYLFIFLSSCSIMYAVCVGAGMGDVDKAMWSASKAHAVIHTTRY
jgi:hypothetical protein